MLGVSAVSPEQREQVWCMRGTELLTRPQTASAKFVPVENLGRLGLDIDVLIFETHAVSSVGDRQIFYIVPFRTQRHKNRRTKHP